MNATLTAPVLSDTRIRSGPVGAIAACCALAALSLALPGSPSYDPWAWLVWGRDVAHLRLHIGAAPSWKPLPVLLTTPFSLAGSAAPALWLIVSRAGALVGVLMAARLAARLVSPRTRWFAAMLAAAALLLVHDYVRRAAVGNAEGLLVGLGLMAVERHVDGCRRQALLLAAAAALIRPEAWPFLGLYIAYLWIARREGRGLAVAVIAAVPALWFAPPLISFGDAFQASSAALVPLREGGETQHHGLRVVTEFLGMLPLPVKLVLPVALPFLVRRGAPRRRLNTLLAGAAIAWIAIVAVLAQRGYAAVPRYLFLPAAVTAIAASAGLTRGVEACALWLGRGLGRSREAVFAAAVLAVGAAVVITGERAVSSLGSDARDIAAEATRDDGLGAALASVGGPRAALACGRPITGWFEVSALAWRLGVETDQVARRSVRGAPEVVFVWRPGRPGIGGPLPRHSRTLVTTPQWRVLARCVPGGANAARAANRRGTRGA